MNETINVVLYSYKNKNTLKVVEKIFLNSKAAVAVHLIDQHPLDRRSLFEKYENVNYHHVQWDWQHGESYYRDFAIKRTNSKYVLVISDDILLNPGWDEELINFVSDRDIVVSGSGMGIVAQKDKFFLSRKQEASDAFTISNYIDRNLLFAKTETLKSIKYPSQVKYYGQEELLSVFLFCKGVEVYAAPTSLYVDTEYRSIENLYCPFSLEHNYNVFIDLIKNGSSDQHVPGGRSIKDFLEFHSIEIDKIYRLPFQNNDVEYDYIKLNWTDGRRFIGKTNSI
jgi:hypothetical protein